MAQRNCIEQFKNLLNLPTHVMACNTWFSGRVKAGRVQHAGLPASPAVVTPIGPTDTPAYMVYQLVPYTSNTEHSQLVPYT